MNTATTTIDAPTSAGTQRLAAALDELPSSKRFNAEQRALLYRMAYSALAAGDYDRARRLFEGLTVYAGADGRAWRGLAASAHAQEDYRAAWMYWNVVTLLEDGPPDATFYGARCVAQLGDVDEACEGFDLVAHDERAEPAMRSQAAQLLALLQQRRAA